MWHADWPSSYFDEFEPILDQLAARMAHRDDVIVAKLDFAANDVPPVPGISNAAYRDCLLFPKGGGEVSASIPTANPSSVVDKRTYIESEDY